MASASEFLRSVQDTLGKGNTDYVLSIFTDDRNNDEVKNNAWDLIPVIAQYLTKNHESNQPDVYRCCNHLLNIIVRVSNPEEVLLQLIEEIEESEDDTKFISLLDPLKRILFRLPLQRLNSLAWSLNALQTYLNKCDIPEYGNLVGKEKLLLDNSEDILKITYLYSKVLVFYEQIVKKLKQHKEDVREYMAVTCKFLIELLGKPLACLDMDNFDNLKSKTRIIAESIVFQIFEVNSDPMKLVEMRFDLKNDNLSLKIPGPLGVAVLFYLVYSESLCLEKVIKVYNPIYLFHRCLYLVTSLIEVDNQMCSEKALTFGSTLLKHIKYIQLPYLLLDSEDHCRFCKALCNLIIYNETEYIRKTALNIYQSYLLSFETRGFYLLIYNLVSTLNHSGLIGFTVTQYKDQLAKEFSKNNRDISIYFKGSKLLALLRKFCYLYKNEESDLIELCDQIMATLNLLRYLALRDQNNMTNIWEYFRILENSYFQHLRKGIDLSRAHYELKIKELQEEIGSSDKNIKSDISVMVAGKSLLEMSKDEKCKVLHSSLTALDLMDSLLNRVIECIELNKH